MNADGAAEDGAGGRSAAASLSHRGQTPLKYPLLYFFYGDLCLIYTQTYFPFLFFFSIHFTADIFTHLSVTHRLRLTVSVGEKSKHNHAENQSGGKKDIFPGGFSLSRLVRGCPATASADMDEDNHGKACFSFSPHWFPLSARVQGMYRWMCESESEGHTEVFQNQDVVCSFSLICIM